jgi:hypothetical protein
LKEQNASNLLTPYPHQNSEAYLLGEEEQDLKTQVHTWNDKQAERIQELSCGMLSSPCQTWNVTGVAFY